MSAFGVLPIDVAQASVNCHATADEILGKLFGLQNYVEEIGAEWLGVASGTFQIIMDNWTVYARMLHNALDDIGTGLQNNFIADVRMEEENNGQIQQIDGLFQPMNLGPVPVGPTAAPGDFTN